MLWILAGSLRSQFRYAKRKPGSVMLSGFRVPSIRPFPLDDHGVARIRIAGVARGEGDVDHARFAQGPRRSIRHSLGPTGPVC